MPWLSYRRCGVGPHTAAARGARITTEVHQAGSGRPRGPLAAVGRVLLAIANALRLTPNALTLLGLAGVCGVGALIIARVWVVAGLLYVAFSLADSLDGTLARAQGRSTSFGAFLDSTLDRVAEGIILGALGIVLAQKGHAVAVGACFAALTASFMVSYTRARSEGLGIDSNKGGLMGRPERLVLTGAGIFMGGLGSVLPVVIYVLAALSTGTALHRMLHVRTALDARDRGSQPPG